MNEWLLECEWGREKWEGGAVTSVSLWQMCVLAWRRRDIKSLLIIFLFPELTGVSVPGGFRSERSADRCTPLVASMQDSLWCTFSSSLAFFAIFFFSLHPRCLFDFFVNIPWSHFPCCFFPHIFFHTIFYASFPFMVHAIFVQFIYHFPFIHPFSCLFFFFRSLLFSTLVFPLLFSPLLPSNVLVKLDSSIHLHPAHIHLPLPPCTYPFIFPRLLPLRLCHSLSQYTITLCLKFLPLFICPSIHSSFFLSPSFSISLYKKDH